MKKEQNAEDVNIRVIVEQVDKIELVDTLETAEFKEEVTIPYLNGLYQDLILRSDAPDKGIPRVVLTDVSVVKASLLVLEFARNYWGEILFPL